MYFCSVFSLDKGERWHKLGEIKEHHFQPTPIIVSVMIVTICGIFFEPFQFQIFCVSVHIHSCVFITYSDLGFGKMSSNLLVPRPQIHSCCSPLFWPVTGQKWSLVFLLFLTYPPHTQTPPSLNVFLPGNLTFLLAVTARIPDLTNFKLPALNYSQGYQFNPIPHCNWIKLLCLALCDELPNSPWLLFGHKFPFHKPQQKTYFRYLPLVI